MATIDWPDLPQYRPATIEWALVVPEAGSTSVFNQSTQSIGLGPAYWTVTVGIGPRRRTEALAWEAFLLQFAETATRVRIWDWRYEAPAGVAGGTPRVNGAGQTGRLLNTDGWPASTSGLLLPGDWVGVNYQARRVVASVTSNGAGQATLTLDQPLRSSPADDLLLTLAKPSGVFICTTDKRSRGFVQEGARVRGPTLQFMEVFE